MMRCSNMLRQLLTWLQSLELDTGDDKHFMVTRPLLIIGDHMTSSENVLSLILLNHSKSRFPSLCRLEYQIVLEAFGRCKAGKT